MGFLHPLHFSLFPFKEQSLYGVTRPQFVHLANLSSIQVLETLKKGFPTKILRDLTELNM